MENALLVGLSRQITLQRNLEVIANNVANMNTTGFKSRGVNFEEFISPRMVPSSKQAIRSISPCVTIR